MDSFLFSLFILLKVHFQNHCHLHHLYGLILDCRWIIISPCFLELLVFILLLGGGLTCLMLSVYFGYLHGKDMLFPHITFCRSFHNHFKDNLDHNQLHKMMTLKCIHSLSSDLSKLLSELSPPSLSGSQNNSSNICMHHESSPLLRGII